MLSYINTKFGKIYFKEDVKEEEDLLDYKSYNNTIKNFTLIKEDTWDDPESIKILKIATENITLDKSAIMSRYNEIYDYLMNIKEDFFTSIVIGSGDGLLDIMLSERQISENKKGSPSIYTFEWRIDNYDCMCKTFVENNKENIILMYNNIGDSREILQENKWGNEYGLISLNELCLINCNLIFIEHTENILSILKGSSDVILKFKPIIVCNLNFIDQTIKNFMCNILSDLYDYTSEIVEKYIIFINKKI